MGARRQVTRRQFLTTGVAFTGGVLAGIGVRAADRSATARAASAQRTLVYLDTDTPASFDLDQTGIRLPDQRVYTFHLRPDAKSSLGNPLTADDVIWSFQRSAALNQTGGFFADVMGVAKGKMEALDPHTVRFTLPTRNPIFLRVDAMKYYGGLFDSKAAKAHATSADPWAKAYLASHTAGFDAYMVESYVKGQQVTLVANPHWYRGKPYYDRIVWK